MKPRDGSTQHLRREDLFRHFVLFVEHACILNPEGELRRSVRRHRLAVEHGATHAGAVAAGCHEVANVGGLFARQETIGCFVVDPRLNENVAFLNAAVNDADGRGVGVWRDRSYLRSKRGSRGIRILRQGDAFRFDDLEDVRITNEVP